MSLTAPTGKTQTLGAGLLTAGMAITVGTALGFQHIGGYIPCKLCLEQRLPYYIGIPVVVLALLSSVLKFPPLVTRGLLLAGALLMTWSVWLGAFHSGVEWGLWAGPSACSGTAPVATGGNLLDSLQQARVVRCDEAPWRLAGLSLAGFNALIGAVLTVVAFRASAAR